MAAVAITTGYPKTESWGSNMVYIWKVTSVEDAETLATGLSGRIKYYFVNWVGNPGTQASGGGHSTESAGVITFYPSTDALEATVFVLT